MHQTRQQVSVRIPIKRKGTKYVVRQRSDIKNSVPVLIAVRDMLKLARTTKEVKHMIKEGLIKINNRLVRDHRESIKLFNLFFAGKNYKLSILPTGRFIFVDTDEKNRLCKIIGKKKVAKNDIQLNLHDGTNVIGDKSFEIGDSVYLDSKGKIHSHIRAEAGRTCFIYSGKYTGQEGKIISMEKGKIRVKLEKDDKNVLLDLCEVIVT